MLVAQNRKRKTTFNLFFNTNKSIMKKFFSMMMIAAAVFTFAACDNGGEEPGGQGGGNKGGKLATPEISETHTETSITVSWGAVENAEAYRVNLKGKNYTTEELSYTLENLNAGEYTVRVMAMAEGYEDSDMAEITVTLTGATSVDWFTQTVSLSEEDAENGIYPYNSIDFFWKGTGVKDLRYGLYETAQLEGLTDADIKQYLSDLGKDANAIIADINGEGFPGQFGGALYAGTEYALCVEVTNADGVKFFTKNTITTETFEIPAETQAWIGQWNAKTSQVLTIGQDGKGVLSDQDNTFTFTVAASPAGPNTVVIDGLSVLGEGNPTVGYVVETIVDEETGATANVLEISTNLSIGTSAEGITYYWLPYVAIDGELLGLNMFNSEVPAHYLMMNADGTVTGGTGVFGVKYQDGTEAECEVICSELYGIDAQSQLYFLIESWPAVYRAGAMEVTKAAAPTAKRLNKEVVNYPMSLSYVAF